MKRTLVVLLLAAGVFGIGVAVVVGHVNPMTADGVPPPPPPTPWLTADGVPPPPPFPPKPPALTV